MKILYDYQAFTMQQFGGVSKCFCELISHLPGETKYQIGIKQSKNAHLIEKKLVPNLCLPYIDEYNFITKLPFRGKKLLYSLSNSWLPFLPSVHNVNKKYSINLLKSGDFDIFHPTFFEDYFLSYLKGKPFILTIHDMIPELFPQYYKKNNAQILAKRKMANLAAAIVTVSEQTREDVIRILDVPEEKVKVIYHSGPQKEIIKETPLFGFPYFLYVGTRDGYKNFFQLLDDFAKFVRINPFVKMICTGTPFTYEEKIAIGKLNLQDCLIHINASDSQLKNLYTNAIAFIYPSLYEGFGIPILEAFAYGCPVLLNHKSCFPEIAASAALYFQSDNNSSNIQETLQTIINYTDKQRDELIQSGYKRLSYFSWEKSGRQLYELYQSIL